MVGWVLPDIQFNAISVNWDCANVISLFAPKQKVNASFRYLFDGFSTANGTEAQLQTFGYLIARCTV